MRPTDKVATSNLGRKDEHARHGPAVINPRVLAGVARVGRAHDGHLAESQPAAVLAAAALATQATRAPHQRGKFPNDWSLHRRKR